MELRAAGGLDWEAILAEIMVTRRGLVEAMQYEYLSAYRKSKFGVGSEHPEGEKRADEKQ
jgi:hypothetical protein